MAVRENEKWQTKCNESRYSITTSESDSQFNFRLAMSETVRMQIKQQLQAYETTVHEMAVAKVRAEAQVRYEVVITPIDLSTAEPTFDGTSLHFYFNTRMFAVASIVQRVSQAPEVEKYFHQREGVTFRVDLFIRLFAPTVAGEHLYNHQFTSTKLDKWDVTQVAVHNPDGCDEDADDWLVDLEFKKPDGKKIAVLNSFTVVHNPNHCSTLLKILEAEAIDLEEMRLMRLMKSAPLIAPPTSIGLWVPTSQSEPIFTGNHAGQARAKRRATTETGRAMLDAYKPPLGFD